MTDRVALLRRTVEAIAKRQHPGRLLEGEEAIAFLSQDGIHYGRFSPKSGILIGLAPPGASAVAALAADLRRTDPAYRRGSSLLAFATVVAGKVLDRFGETAAPAVDADDVAALEVDLRTWFDGVAIPRGSCWVPGWW